jgi:transposase
VLLGDPPQVPKIQGRPKSDVHGGQWRRRLQTCGLLAGAVRPPDQVCVRRSALRPRAMFRSAASPPRPHRHKALPQMHLKRQPVVSDVPGETGMAILRAMRAGGRDPVPWARLRHDRGHHAEETSAKARHGQWREAPRWACGQAVAREAMYQEQRAACERQRAAHLETCAEGQDREALPPGSRPRQRARHRPQVDGRGARPRITGGDGAASAGIDAPTALPSSSATGRDMGRWPTVKPCTSGRGRCRQPRVAGGHVFSRGPKPRAHRVATALRRAASGLRRGQRARGAFCRRRTARWGTPTALHGHGPSARPVE